MEELRSSYNIQNEVLFLGSLYRQPDLYISYGQYIRSKYDFYDDATKFFYDNFELMYKTFSQTVDEIKINTFMSQEVDRLRTYKQFGGYSTIRDWVEITDTENAKHYFNIVKKYSLVREYERNGYPIQKILQHSKFNEWNANDIYKLIRAKADKINTIILANEESVVLNDNISKVILDSLAKPDVGLSYPYTIINDLFRGIRNQNMISIGMLSNEGKSRFMTKLVAYVAFKHGEPVAVLANEMTEKEIKFCLLTTVLNNKEFQELHGINIQKNEKEITLGLYKDDLGKFVYRKVDEYGEYLESEVEFHERLLVVSEEYVKVLEVAKWVEEQSKNKIYFKELITYDDITLDFEIKKHNLIYGIKYFFYDTLKNDGGTIGDWAALKVTTTKLKELANSLKVFIYGSIQLTDDTVFTSPLAMSSNNISNCKQVKHLLDQLCLVKRLNKEEYGKFRCKKINLWGKPMETVLDYNKTYYAFSIDKNRQGEKGVLLFSVDLNTNEWYEEGYLVSAPKEKE